MAALGFENYKAVRSQRSVVVVVLVLMLTTTTTVKVVDGGAVDECAQQLAGMATCLPYVQGEAMAPTPDCCSGLKQVLSTNKTCLCVIIQDRNDPDLGLQINVTLALGLPSVCHVAANISKCPELLHLDPKSPEAQVFYQLQNNSTQTAANGPAPGPSSTAAAGGPVSGISSNSGAARQNGGMFLVGYSWGFTFMLYTVFAHVHLDA
ncbi:putative plant lipid transfer protein/Par allergen [Rosa chinensis]|uniref:Putative plant lipid transfer protein/Par allergen n=1 Tax=Rosa chinensis TaxID=74649 RepID=A0A2P6S6T3_ROSCH|nr:non-specific lipid transfer protein GPI-anchored 14 isoform X1 [Rosa chinensis]PRQ54400.1 putative plant lipid transfer protein/Par allergen [Rosa chinensis]